MPAVLATIEQFREFLGIEDVSEDDLLASVLEGVESWFTLECGRE
jgi:hypothetical protein